MTDEQLAWVQNKLFNLGAALSLAPGEWIDEADVKQLETWIDAMQEAVPPQRTFILPAGGETVCRCHIVRTVCRRAERRMIEANAKEAELRFMNRLSDYLFVLSRFMGFLNGEKEEKWEKK
jgi:cob(I)alamin adenosyltransferase